jgi:hypothetical protein
MDNLDVSYELSWPKLILQFQNPDQQDNLDKLATFQELQVSTCRILVQKSFFQKLWIFSLKNKNYANVA